MKKKNGFVFVETLVVVSILTISLLMAYATYSSLIIKEKTRITYNDSVYLYRTYYLEKFFKSFRLDEAAKAINEIVTYKEPQKDESGKIIGYIDKPVMIDAETELRQMITSFGCSENIFKDESTYYNIWFCQHVWEKLHVTRLYLTFKDLGFLQNCNNSVVGECSLLLMYNPSVMDYMRTIGGKSKVFNSDVYNSGYRIIAEFEVDERDKKCDSNSKNCQTYYATISIGDILYDDTV